MAIDKKTSELLDNLTNQSIKIMNEALTEKDKIIELWQERTLELSAKNRQCYICLSDKDWMPETLTCKNCHWKAKEFQHE
ncbi:hypothetical protein [endosymbiont GvMRE of Glomus versiforme]|uniref:hypothetical protein n=1 Tax=endosymbiont GvMRE of Glomus versiforme TaxID=2039283 RepID=UPI000EC3594C|nr:hypothetical protein [endosymbiont GvMRE of Glomus versiforme]RHZ37630.1 hypothetical protein GvMRE_I1g1 [endosymbiont GvMRE of Glomus versiforme]